MLNAHPEICVPPECGFAHWLRPAFHARDVADPDVRTEFVHAVLQSRKFDGWNMNFSSLYDCIDAYNPQDYPSLTWCIGAAYAQTSGIIPAWVGDKNNYYIHHLEQIAAWFPRSRLLCITRDGRDVACSYLALSRAKITSEQAPRLSSDIAEIAEGWSSHVGDIHRLLRDKPSRAMHVRFEDLVLDPQATLTKCVKWLGLDWNPSMLRYPGQNDEPPAYLEWKALTKHPPDPSAIGRYKTAMTGDELRVFESRASQALTSLGYGLEGGAGDCDHRR